MIWVSNKILSDLFYGNIVPNEKQFDRAMLDGDALATLDRMIRLQGTITGMTAEGYFIDGFQTGFRLAAAVLYEGEKPFLKAVSEGS